jgi:hypothetical protein
MSARRVCGIAFTVCDPFGSVRVVRLTFVRAWPFSLYRSCIGKCMREREFRRTVRVKAVPVSGRACLRSLPGGFSRASRCQSWKFPHTSDGTRTLWSSPV